MKVKNALIISPFIYLYISLTMKICGNKSLLLLLLLLLLLSIIIIIIKLLLYNAKENSPVFPQVAHQVATKQQHLYF